MRLRPLVVWSYMKLTAKSRKKGTFFTQVHVYSIKERQSFESSILLASIGRSWSLNLSNSYTQLLTLRISR